MILTLFNNKTDSRYLKKNIKRVGSNINNFYLKDKTEVINPIIILDNFPPDVNYCYLSEFDRYYFLKHVTHNEGQIITEWHCDVLMSFQKDLLKMKVLAKRNTYHGSSYVNDEEMLQESYTHDIYKAFEGGTAFSPNNNNFVLCTMGCGDSTSNENTNNNNNNENSGNENSGNENNENNGGSNTETPAPIT